MDSFLPDLVLTLAFMQAFEEFKLLKQPFLVVLPGDCQDFFGSTSFKVSNHL